MLHGARPMSLGDVNNLVQTRYCLARAFSDVSYGL